MSGLGACGGPVASQSYVEARQFGASVLGLSAGV